MTRSAVTLVPRSGAVDALLVMAHPHRSAESISLTVHCAGLFLWLLSLLIANRPAQAQQFQMSNYSMGYLGQNTVMLVFIVENDSPSNGISSFTISNICSVMAPQPFAMEAGWDYSVHQNPSNTLLWNLTETNDMECPDCFQSIPTNGGTYMGSFTTTFPPNAERVVFGMASASVAFVGSGAVQGRPFALLVPLGWQSAPLKMWLQPGQTRGLLTLSWAGADGSIYVEHKSTLADTNWQVLAGPVCGGTCSITTPTNTVSDFLRLRLGP